MRKRLFRVLSGSIVAVLVAVCGLALAACSSGPSAEELIREDLTRAFDQVKEMDDATIDDLVHELNVSSLETYGIDGTQLVESMIDGFDYSIDSVTVDEAAGTAEAAVTVTSKSMNNLYGELETALAELTSSPVFLTLIGDQDAFNARIGELAMEAIDRIEPDEKHLELAYTKKDGEWTMDVASGAALSQVFVTPGTSLDTDVVDEVQTETQTEAEAETQAEPTETVAPSAGATASQQNALESAQSYLSFSNFSHDGLIGQLEFEGFSTEDATWAADNCGADWNAQALGSAQSYLDYTAFSYTGLIDQLEFEGFTTEQATYAADSCGADWNEQAAKSAQSYLDYTSFSRDGLIDQLEFEGFTHDQAVYGVDSVGL